VGCVTGKVVFGEVMLPLWLSMDHITSTSAGDMRQVMWSVHHWDKDHWPLSTCWTCSQSESLTAADWPTDCFMW